MTRVISTRTQLRLCTVSNIRASERAHARAHTLSPTLPASECKSKRSFDLSLSVGAGAFPQPSFAEMPESSPHGKSTGSSTEHVFADTYAGKGGPGPVRTLVWSNIWLMVLLHAGALYGVCLIPTARALTLAWSK